MPLDKSVDLSRKALHACFVLGLLCFALSLDVIIVFLSLTDLWVTQLCPSHMGWVGHRGPVLAGVIQNQEQHSIALVMEWDCIDNSNIKLYNPRSLGALVGTS